MNPQRRTRARILTAEGLTKLCNRIREREIKDNFGRKYTREELGELTGLDPGTIGAVLDCRGSDRSSINRCFTAFGLTLQDSDHVGKTQDIQHFSCCLDTGCRGETPAWGRCPHTPCT